MPITNTLWGHKKNGLGCTLVSYLTTIVDSCTLLKFIISGIVPGILKWIAWLGCPGFLGMMIVWNSCMKRRHMIILYFPSLFFETQGTFFPKLESWWHCSQLLTVGDKESQYCWVMSVLQRQSSVIFRQRFTSKFNWQSLTGNPLRFTFWCALLVKSHKQMRWTV